LALLIGVVHITVWSAVTVSGIIIIIVGLARGISIIILRRTVNWGRHITVVIAGSVVSLRRDRDNIQICYGDDLIAVVIPITVAVSIDYNLCE
jgi:hypothetical protein